MVKPEESSSQSQSARAEKKSPPSDEKQNSANDQPPSERATERNAGQDQPSGADEAANDEQATAGDDSAEPAKRTASVAKATPPPVTKPPKAEELAPAPASSADDALVAAGERYLYGDGAAENCALAQRNLQAAAAHSNARALSMLGAMYATGHCSNRDLPTAYKYFAKALRQDPGNGRIQRDLEVLWRQMNANERQAATRN